MCGFGIHLEKRPHRFDQLWERNPKEWEMWMTHVDKLPDGTWYGWGHVLDYIGVEWRDPWTAFEQQIDLLGIDIGGLDGMAGRLQTEMDVTERGYP